MNIQKEESRKKFDGIISIKCDGKVIYAKNTLNNQIEKAEEEFEKTKEYEELLEKYQNNYEHVRQALPKEKSFELIDNMEEAFNKLCEAACEYFYKQGVRDNKLIDNLIKIFTAKSLPISNHPLFNETWNSYSEKSNKLLEKLEEKNIDVNELINLIEAAQKVERLGCLEAYKLGFNDGRANV